MIASNKKGVLGINIPKKVLIFIASVLVIGFVSGGIYYLFDSALNTGSTNGAQTNARAGGTKDTGFDGVSQNDDDPAAISAYCDDIISLAKKDGGASRIKDMCILNSIPKEYIPFMTNEQIAKMAEEQPTCLETGYDSDGYNCFTGFDKDGCSLEGVDGTGAECRVAMNVDDGINKLLVGNIPENICSMVNDCQSENAFGVDGLNEFNCDRQGRKEDGTLCPYEYITRIYGDDGRDQLGFSVDGMNENGCDVKGLTLSGEMCALADVTQVFNRKGKDQWGFDSSGFNDNNCSIDGLDINDDVCDINDITRVIDPLTGLDQFGLDKDGFSPTSGCSLAGFNRAGERCDIKDIPRIFGKKGFDQFGLRKNNRNSFNCDLAGLKPNGDVCNPSDITRIFDPTTGKDQLGFFENNRNEFGCDFNSLKSNGDICSIDESTRILNPKNGRDSLGLDANAFNDKNCDLNGLKPSGEICDISDITRIYPDGGEFDQFQLDKAGFNDKNCSLEGLNRQGDKCDEGDIPRIYNADGFDQFNIDKEGFNPASCDVNGRDRNGQLCDFDDIPRIFQNGVDQFNLDKNGYSVDTGCNFSGYKIDGSRCKYEDIPKIFDADGKNQMGLDAENRNIFECDLNGVKPDGTLCSKNEKSVVYDDQNFNPYHQDKDGFGRLSFNDMGYNSFNCDVNGRKPTGEICDIDEITRIYDPATGRDQFALDKSGFNHKNCNLAGFDRNNNACSVDDVPRIFDINLNDQFGENIDNLPGIVWEKQAESIAGISAMVGDDGEPLFLNGEKVFIDRKGNLIRADGTPIIGEDGSQITIGEDGTIKTKSGAQVPSSSFTDSDGNLASGKFSKATDMFNALTDATGEPLKFNGEDVFVDDQGLLRKSDGSFLLGRDGKPLSLNENGEVVDSNGVSMPLGTFKRQDGKSSIGKLFSQEYKKANNGKTQYLTNSDGEVLLHDGKAVQVGLDGYLRDEDGILVTDEAGNPLKLNSLGQVVTDDGRVIPSSMFVNSKGEPAKGLLKSSGQNVDYLTNSDGEVLLYEGKPVQVGVDGYLRSQDGSLILDNEGKPLKLNSLGQIVNEDGKIIPSSMFSNAKGIAANGPLTASSEDVNYLTNSDGELLLFDDEPVQVGLDGYIRDLDGKLITDDNGNPLKLNSLGQIVNDEGQVMPSSMFATTGNAKGKLSESSEGVNFLTNSDGELLLFKGEPVQVGADGYLTDAAGNVVTDKNGNPLKLNSRGQFINDDGEIVSPSIFTNTKGERAEGALTSSKQGADYLMNSDDELLLFEGKPVQVGLDGYLVDPDGNVITDKNGNPLKLNSRGQLVNDDGEIISPSIFTNAKGEIAKGALSTSKQDTNYLTNSDGELLLLNGKAVQVGLDGKLRDEDGNLVTDKDGNPLRLNSDGLIVNDDGDVVSPSMFTNKDGKPAKGSLKVSSRQGEYLTDADGELLLIDGKPLQVGLDGYLRGTDGKILTDDNGVPLKLNSKGQIVNDNGEVIPLSMFTNSKGQPSQERYKQSIDGYNESEVEAKLLADKLTEKQRKDLGIGSDGFNNFGCGLNGLDRSGKVCKFSNIPKLYDPDTGLDQLGFGADSFNAFGCDFAGKNRDNEDCDPQFITEIFGTDGFNQLNKNKAGFGRSGLNINNENALGCTPSGEGDSCTDKNSPLLIDGAGVNQFNKALNGRDRLGLVNGFNSAGCGINGQNRRGELCDIADIPRFLNENGEDQFGVKANSFNRFDCSISGRRSDGSICPLNEIPRIFDANGLDQFKLSLEGFSVTSCGLNGFDANGQRCEYQDIPKIYGEDGFNQLGFLEDGYNSKGCDFNGLNRQKQPCKLENVTRIFDPVTGLDQFNLSRDGFNEKSCGIDGLNRQGEICSYDDIPKVINPETGLNQFNIGIDGFNDKNCDFYGYDRSENLCEKQNLTRIFDKDGNDQYRANKVTGRNENGCDLNNLDRQGRVCKPSMKINFKNADGFNQDGFKNGLNASNCDINGLNSDGERCDLKNITRLIDPVTGLDQLGLDESFRNKFKCDVNGRMPDGSVCQIDKIFHWYNAEGKDQFTLSREGLNSNECNLMGYKGNGVKCSLEDTTRIFSLDGLDQNNLDVSGFGVDGKDPAGFYASGCNDLNKNIDGENCSKYKDIPIDARDVAEIAARKALSASWLSIADVDVKPIGEGTYKYEMEMSVSQTNQQGLDPTLVNTQSSTLPVSVRDALERASSVDGNSGSNTDGEIEIPVGYMTQIYVKQAVNSDYTQEVYAEIILGELDTALLIGRMVVPYVDDPIMPRDKFYFEFTKMVYNREVIAIDAISINLNNDSGMVTAEDVNYHYVQRYGGLVVATAIQALDATFLDSQAEKDARLQADITEQSIISAGAALGENTRNLTKNNFKVATGYINELAKAQFSRRPTITDVAGPQLIVFREQVDDDRIPIVFTGIE